MTGEAVLPHRKATVCILVDEVGLEPTMPEAEDLQSPGVTNFPTHPWTLISCCFNKPLTLMSDAVTR